MDFNNWKLLSDVASIFGCEEKQLIKKIYEQHLPLHVIPANWYAHIWILNQAEAEAEDEDEVEVEVEAEVKVDVENKNKQHNVIEFNHELFERTSNILKPFRPEEPLPLSKKNVQTLYIKGVISEDVFEATDAIQFDGGVAYYKLCQPLDYTKNLVATITYEDIVIRSDYFEELKEIVKKTPIVKTITDNEKNKLLRMIGLFALILSKQATKYSKGESPNYTTLSAYLIEELNIIKNETAIETSGLADTNLRAAMAEGTKLLYGKKI